MTAHVEAPTPEQVRAVLAELGTRERKIVGGLIVVLMQHADRAPDREWVSEQLVHLTLHAGGFDDSTESDGVQAVETYLADHAAGLFEAGYLLFRRVGADLQPRAEQGFTLEEAMQIALGYFR